MGYLYLKLNIITLDNVSLFLINYNTGLKLNIQKIMIMASDPTTSWEIDGETVETVRDFIGGGGGLQNHCRWWL